MKFSVSSGELLTRLQAQSKAIDPKIQIAELTNFLFDINENTLRITASDSEITIISELTINNMEGPSRFLISGVKLLEFLKKLPEQSVTFREMDKTESGFSLEISTALGKNTQIAQFAEAYPEVPNIEPDFQSFSIDAEALISGVSKTAFAACVDDMRPVMAGVFFDIKQDSITFVATDSHKLALLKRTDVECENECSFILGRKAANLVKSVIMKNDGMINIQFDSKNAIINSANYRIYCRHIQSPYPKYNSVIPTNNTSRIIVNRADLVNSIARVSLFTDGSGLIRFEIQSNVMKVSAQDCGYNCSADEAIPCQYEGDAMEIGFKAVIITDILANMDSENIEIQLSDPSRPGVLVPTEKKENEEMLMLMMPMNV